MKPQAMNIIKMISKPYNERMPFEGVQLTKFIQKLPFFKRFFPYQSQKFISLCLSSFLLQFENGQDLYSKQKQPNLIYIIIQGLLQVESKASKTIRTVQSYDLIGHVQVVFNIKQRGQKIKVINPTYCMVINSQKFMKVWQKQKQQQIQKSYNYLTSNKYFQTLSNYDKKYLALMLIKNSFKQGQIIVSNGSAINQRVIFIIYGQIYVIKKIKIKGIQKQVILQSLQQMDSYGEYQALNKLPNDVNLRANSIGTYYSIMINQPLEVNHPFVQLAKQKGLPYPQKQQLEFRFQVQTSVERYKNQVKKKLKLYK